MARAILSRSKLQSVLSGTSSMPGFKSTGEVHRTLTSSLPSTHARTLAYVSCLGTRRYEDNPANTFGSRSPRAQQLGRALQPLPMSQSSRPYSSWNDGVSAASGAADKMGGLDPSSIGSGVTAFAEACGVSVQSLLLGGLAVAFVVRKLLRNVLGGVSLRNRFSLGDTIKVGSIDRGKLNFYMEGRVVDMGLTTISLLTAEKYQVTVTNSLFQSQVIVNKSRAEQPSMVTQFRVESDDWDKIPQVIDDIKNMLKAHPKVFMEKDVPYCFLSRVENSYAELTIGCNLKHMSKDELYSARKDIEWKAIRIIGQHEQDGQHHA